MQMTHSTASLPSRRRTGRRYTILVFIVFALVAGWIGFWKFAAGKAQATIDGWRAREAAAGRVYECGSQSIGGFPFRFEVDCGNATVLLRDNKPPLEVKAAGLLAVMQVYQPTLLISEVTGPLSIAAPGQTPEFVANWTLGACQSARHAGGAAARLDRIRASEPRPHERRCTAEPAASQTHRTARPYRRGLRRQQSGDRGRASPIRRLGAGLASGRAAADQCRHRRLLARSEGFLAQAVAGALSRAAGGRRPHRH